MVVFYIVNLSSKSKSSYVLDNSLIVDLADLSNYQRPFMLVWQLVD